MCAVCVPEPVTRLPGSASGTCFAGPHSPWSPPSTADCSAGCSALFAGFTATMSPALRPARALLARIPLGLRPSLHWLRRSYLHRGLLRRVFRVVRRLHSYYGEVRLPTPVHHRLRLLTFPIRTRSAHGLWSDAGYPRFRRDPFARDVALDLGGTTMPRIAALHMLRSTMKTVSAPAISSFRGSLPHPTHPLCTLRVRRHRRLTQLASRRLAEPYLSRTCTG